MFWVYAIESEKNGRIYVGQTSDVTKRLADHDSGRVASTAVHRPWGVVAVDKAHTEGRVPATERRRPLKLIYYEACLSETDAFRREKYLKTSYGKRYIKSRLRDYFTGFGP